MTNPQNSPEAEVLKITLSTSKEIHQMKTFFYLFTILLLSLLLACSEDPPTNIDLENLNKKPVPPPPADPLVLLDGPNQVVGIYTVRQGNNDLGFIRVWTYEGSYTQTWERGGDGYYIDCVIGDSDNDGHDELLVVYRFETGKGRNKVTHYHLQVFENGDTDEPSRFLDLENNGVRLVVADANSDGFQEIVGGGREHVYVFEDDGTEITELWQSPDNTYDDLPWDLDVGDADNDQQNEIVYAGLAAGKFAVYDYLGGNTWGNKVYSEPIAIGLDQAKVADVDGDGANEVIGGGNYNKLTVWEYVNGAYVIDFESADLGGFTQGVAAGDFDNDGKDEIAVGTALSSNSVYVFKYDGSNYVNIYSNPITGMVSKIFAGDSDNDGIDEFVVASGDNLLVYDYEGSYIQRTIDAESVYPVMVK
jgi:hypothetical protein